MLLNAVVDSESDAPPEDTTDIVPYLHFLNPEDEKGTSNNDAYGGWPLDEEIV